MGRGRGGAILDHHPLQRRLQWARPRGRASPSPVFPGSARSIRRIIRRRFSAPGVPRRFLGR
eukprot:1473620-Pyramimonas_sp.AAC.1